MTLVRLGTRTVFALGNRCETKVTDSCVSGGIYQDIWLGKKSMGYSDPTLFKEYNAYTLQIPMHRMTGVEIVETFGHIQ